MMDNKREKENLSPTGRLKLTFGKINNEQEKNEEEKKKKKKSDTRNKPNDRGSSGKKDR